jgi:hypothetical protein
MPRQKYVSAAMATERVAIRLGRRAVFQERCIHFLLQRMWEACTYQRIARRLRPEPSTPELPGYQRAQLFETTTASGDELPAIIKMFSTWDNPKTTWISS